MPVYDQIPSMDSSFNFPPEILATIGAPWAVWRNVPATQDLNTYRTPGISRITSADTATIVNLPTGMNAAGMFENVKTFEGGGLDVWWVQRVTQHGSNPRFWWRSTKDLVGGWNSWNEVVNWAPSGRSVPADADLNTYKVPGISRIRTPDTATIVNLPPGMRTAGTFQNSVNGDGTDTIITQIIFENGTNGRVFWRSPNDDGSFGEWSRMDESDGPVTEWHVFLAAGQSNMSGRGIVSTAVGGRYKTRRIAQFGFTRRILETATVPLDMHDTATGLSPATTAAQAYLKSQPSHVGVLIVPAAHGGTGFGTTTTTYTWTPNTATNPLYDLPASAVTQTLDAIAAAKATGTSVVLKAILWHQGEANGSFSTATYATNLDNLIAYFRAQLSSPNLAFVVGQMVPEGITANSPGRVNIDVAHQQTTERVPYTAFAPATTGAYNPGDTTHMNKAGVDFIGRNYAAEIAAALTREDIQTRVKALETLGGLTPGDASDITVKTLLNNPASQSAIAAKAIADSSSATKISASEKGAASGVASLTAQGHVPSAQGAVGQPVDQFDYVKSLAERSKYTKMQLMKTNSINDVEITCYSDSGKHTTFQFYGNGGTRDDYRTLAQIWEGTSTPTTVMASKKLYADLTKAGTYIGGAGTFVYTQDKATPATWSVPITVDVAGSTLRFHSYKDNRGGLWQITISGSELDVAVNVSTWSSAAAGAGAHDTNGIILMNNVRAGTYTISGKFIGDDPANVPSTGSGTARGWLANNADATSASSHLVTVYSTFRQVSKDFLVKPDSNMDFAIQTKPSGGSTLEWVPYHGVATAVQADAPVYLDGDVEIDVASMAIGQYRSISSFELVQRVYGRNSTSGTTNLLEIATSQLVRTNSVVSFNGKVKRLANVEVGDNYFIMFPAAMAIFDKLVSSSGNVYRNGVDLIGTETQLVNDNDLSAGYLLLSSTNKNLACAVRYNNPQETIRRGKVSKNPDSTKAFLQHRDSSIVKVYNRPWASGTALAAGTIDRFSGDYIYTQGVGLYDQYAL